MFTLWKKSQTAPHLMQSLLDDRNIGQQTGPALLHLPELSVEVQLWRPVCWSHFVLRIFIPVFVWFAQPGAGTDHRHFQSRFGLQLFGQSLTTAEISSDFCPTVFLCCDSRLLAKLKVHLVWLWGNKNSFLAPIYSFVINKINICYFQLYKRSIVKDTVKFG